MQSYLVEGIGKAFVPAVLDRVSIHYHQKSLVDEWVKTHDKESFLMARELMQKEGLLCGASSGSAVYGAIQWAKQKHLRSDARLGECRVISSGNLGRWDQKLPHKTPQQRMDGGARFLGLQRAD